MTNQLDFRSVVHAWDAGVGQREIHPLGDNEAAYWASGEAQARQAAELLDEGAHVVDFGCGNGRIAIPLAKLGYQVTAADSSAKMLEWLSKNAAAAGVEIETLQTDGDNLAKKLGKRKADAILARAVLIHHDYAGVERIVTNLSSALKKSGLLIADWPLGEKPGERATWISVTTWEPAHRIAVAEKAGLAPLRLAEEPSVWRKA